MRAATLRQRAIVRQPAAGGGLGARLAAWRYRGEQRDLRFDLLRGVAVFAMVADHIGGEPSWLFYLTGGNRFFTTAAEGFVFISGLVFGIVYAALITRQGLAEATIKALRRAATLYGLTVLLSLATAVLAYHFRLPWAPAVGADSLRDWVLGVLTLHRTYYLTDVLLLYTLLLVGAALALALCATGRTWVVVALSWGIWGLWQWDYRYAVFSWPIEDNAVFHLPAWQVLFFTGLALGYHRRALARRFGWYTGPWALAVSGGLFAGLIALYARGLADLPTQVQDAFTYKPNVGPGRVFAFAVVATFAVSLLTTCWGPLSRAVGWLFLPLGQHALFAYGAHLFLIMATTKLAPHILGPAPGAGQHAAFQLAGLAVICLLVAGKTGALTLVRRLPLPRPRPVAAAQPR